VLANAAWVQLSKYSKAKVACNWDAFDVSYSHPAIQSHPCIASLLPQHDGWTVNNVIHSLFPYRQWMHPATVDLQSPSAGGSQPPIRTGLTSALSTMQAKSSVS
jgi:hypothetical protein